MPLSNFPEPPLFATGRLEMTALEVIFGLALQFLGYGIQDHGTLDDLPEPFP